MTLKKVGARPLSPVSGETVPVQGRAPQPASALMAVVVGSLLIPIAPFRPVQSPRRHRAGAGGTHVSPLQGKQRGSV